MLKVISFIIILLVLLILINEKNQKENLNNNITCSICDVQGGFLVENSNSKEKEVVIKYDLKTKLGEKITKTKKMKISANGNKKINVYHVADIKKEDVLTLELSVEEYDFFVEIQPYIIICIFVNAILAIILYFYIKSVEREN